MLPGDGFEGDAANTPLASDPAVLALFRGVPRGISETHANVFEPRLGMSYALNAKTDSAKVSAGIFHNRETLNDSTLLGGNPPFQPQAAIENGSADNPGGASAVRQPAVRDHGAGPRVQAPDSLHVGGRGAA